MDAATSTTLVKIKIFAKYTYMYLYQVVAVDQEGRYPVEGSWQRGNARYDEERCSGTWDWSWDESQPD